jgi:formylglycine-generating enzyme required for sulfatase activity
MMRVVLILVLLAFLPSFAHAEKRIALLIGNESYSAEIGRLSNPHNDVALLEKALKGLGFEVAVEQNVRLGGLTRAVNAYARRLQAAGTSAVGFFYYSGHGASDGTTNYLIPIDVKTTESGELWDESLRLTEVTRKLKAEAGNATHIVVFDACRNTLKLTRPGSRAIVQSKGFVPVAQENGMLIAYATAEGELASDVGSEAGPYAKTLAEEIVKPGVEAVVMFRAVQRRVRAAIQQEPYLGFNALGDVFFAGKADTIVSTGEVERAWAAVKDTKSTEVLQSFIERYKDTIYAELARAQKRDLEARQKMALAAVDLQVKRLEALEKQRREEEDRKRTDDQKKEQVAIATPPPTPRPPLPSARCDGVETEVGNERRCVKPNDTFKDCPECPEMVVVPAGSFIMGSPSTEKGRGKEEDPQHKVTIAKPFAVGKYTVTFAEWDACVVAGGCKHKPEDLGRGRGTRPIINVSWSDATKEYLPWLSRKTGKTYRLLTEAEWEYAARAGTTTAYSWGNNVGKGQANCYGCGSQWDGKQPAPVGSFKPNAFGLYDMHGNVWQWVEDCKHENYNGAPPIDGAAWTTSCSQVENRVLRGGSWDSDPRSMRAADRNSGSAELRGSTEGFRLARTLSP